MRTPKTKPQPPDLTSLDFRRWLDALAEAGFTESGIVKRISGILSNPDTPAKTCLDAMQFLQNTTFRLGELDGSLAAGKRKLTARDPDGRSLTLTEPMPQRSLAYDDAVNSIESELRDSFTDGEVVDADAHDLPGRLKLPLPEPT